MTQFAYSFCMAMLHSLWQAALLCLLYVTADSLIHRNNAPLAKRNFLYIAISAQLLLFVCTFLIYFSGTAGFGALAGTIQNLTGSFNDSNLKIITPWIFSIYLFIITGKLLKAVYGWYQFKQQFKAGLQKPAVDLKLFTELKAYQFGIKRKVKLWLSTSVQTPVTFGYFKPIILLPVALVNNISTSQAETLILHELTHIRTNDYLLNWFLISAETIFFFNPFVTSLCKKIKLEREKNCDVNVLSFEYSPALYAETLLQAERMKQLTPVFQLAAVNRKKHLLQRIQFFSSERVLNQTLRFNIVAPLIGLVLLFMLSTAILFQSKNATAQLQSAAGMHYIPSDNYILPNTEFVSPVATSNILAAPVVDISAENMQPAADQKNTINTAPIICKPAPEDAEDAVTEPEINFAKPITTKENDAAKQIIITEEGSGAASVKSYNLIYVDGKWILQPEWIITAREIATDSLPGKIDSLQRKLRKVYPSQQ